MEAGRLYRTRSLSAVIPGNRQRATSVDPLAGITRSRDDDFRKSMIDKVSRVRRALSVRPEPAPGDYSSSRAARQRHHSVSSSTLPAPSAVYVPVRTPQSAGLVLSGGASVEYWPSTVADPGRSAVRYGSVQPDMLRRRFEIDRMLLPSAVPISRKVIDDDDDYPASRNRMSALLEQLRSVDGPRGRHSESVGDVVSSRAACRAEVDSFAAALGKLSVPTLRHPDITSLPRHRTLGPGAAVDGPPEDSFWARLARARGDLERVEGLATKTFNWNERPPTNWNAASTRTTTTTTKTTESTSPVEVEQTSNGVMEMPREIFTFFNDKDVKLNISSKDTAAEQAVRWAQQRRVQLESDMEQERQRERYGLHNLPSSSFTLRESTGRPSAAATTTTRISSDYLSDDDEYFLPHYVPTIVRPWSSTVRGGADRATATTNFARASDFDLSTRPTRAYTRSISASSVELGRSTAADKLPSSRYDAPTESKAKQQQRLTKEPVEQPSKSSSSGISDVRRKVRAVLAKSRGVPNFEDDF